MEDTKHIEANGDDIESAERAQRRERRSSLRLSHIHRIAEQATQKPVNGSLVGPEAFNHFEERRRDNGK